MVAVPSPYELLPSAKRRARHSDDIFELFPNQEQMVKRCFFQEYPDNGFDREHGSVFTIRPIEGVGLDLGNCFVEVKLKVFKEDGKKMDINDEKKIQPPNDFFNALFSTCELRINGTQIGDDGAYHPQIALLHNLLNYSPEFQNNVLSYSNIFFKSDDTYPAPDPEFQHQYIKESKPLTLFGRLNHNGFTTTRYLLPNTQVDIKLIRNPPEFCLIRKVGPKDKYKVVVSSCKLRVSHLLFHEPALDELSRALSGRVAMYPYIKTTPFRFEIPVGTRMHRSLSFTWGPMAKNAYFVICDHDSLNGRSWENNPMTFPASQYKVNHVQFYCDNKPIMDEPYEVDFNNQNISRVYNELVQIVTDGHKNGKTPGVTYDDMLGQLTIFPAPQNLPYYGSLTVEVGFKKPTTKMLNGLLFLQYDANFTLSKSGEIHAV